MDSKGIDIQWVRMKYDEVQEDSVSKISMRSMEALIGRIEGDFFIEDTGFFIEKLSGFPGPYAAYVQKTIGNNGILKLLGKDQSSAYFETCATLYFKGEIGQFTGILKGVMSPIARGNSGFGYDPIFIPEGREKTLAEMDLNEKNSISHRVKALTQIISYIQLK